MLCISRAARKMSAHHFFLFLNNHVICANKRHTYATIGLMSGVNPAFLAKQLCHSLEVFFKVYAKWINGEDDAREMLKIEASISKIVPELSPR
ncbi:MAG: hypothetical protein JWP38_163 [Herbaspirillum sp.]|jgi:hypothetical protein|nr:hypothetical protein [Herbaspirillum sp.]